MTTLHWLAGWLVNHLPVWCSRFAPRCALDAAYLPWVQQACRLKPKYAAQLVQAAEWTSNVQHVGHLNRAAAMHNWREGLRGER